MRQVLKIYPGSRSAVTGIAVDVVRDSPGRLSLHYFATGRIGDLKLPPIVAPTRTDELWQHTCFEAFIRPAPGPAYWEFNLAPSTQWAAYSFSGTREGMHPATDVGTPVIDVRSSGAVFELQAALDLSRLPETPWHLNISAVIEESSGHKSYWALAHPPGRPDFHNPDCFALELPPA